MKRHFYGPSPNHTNKDQLRIWATRRRNSLRFKCSFSILFMRRHSRSSVPPKTNLPPTLSARKWPSIWQERRGRIPSWLILNMVFGRKRVWLQEGTRSLTGSSLSVCLPLRSGQFAHVLRLNSMCANNLPWPVQKTGPCMEAFLQPFLDLLAVWNRTLRCVLLKKPNIEQIWTKPHLKWSAVEVLIRSSRTIQVID